MAAIEWRCIGTSSLYLQSAFTDDSYSIWITDMYRLWHEKLGRTQIVRRASENGLHIDLSDANNLRIVLEHLSSSLRKDEIHADKAREEQYLELNATIRLPRPLPEASWIFKPTLCTPDEFRRHVTEPLFDKIHGQEQSELDLIQRIKDKDHIIEKLLDQIDKASIDLASIFPALAPLANARKGVSKREAAALVPALAPFDSKAWREDLKQGKFYRGHSPVATRSTLLAASDTEDDVDTEVPENQYQLQEHEHIAYYPQHVAKAPSPTPAVPAKGIKRKIGGKKATPPPAAEFWGLEQSQATSESLPEPVSEPTPAPRGIKKKIGGRKPSPAAEAQVQIPSPRKETESLEARPKGIKRTIGGRKPLADQPTDMSNSPTGDSPILEQKSPVPEKSRVIPMLDEPVANVEMTVEEEAAEAERLADEKRKALRQEMETKSAPKKKRKF